MPVLFGDELDAALLDVPDPVRCSVARLALPAARHVTSLPLKSRSRGRRPNSGAKHVMIGC